MFVLNTANRATSFAFSPFQRFGCSCWPKTQVPLWWDDLCGEDIDSFTFSLVHICPPNLKTTSCLCWCVKVENIFVQLPFPLEFRLLLFLEFLACLLSHSNHCCVCVSFSFSFVRRIKVKRLTSSSCSRFCSPWVVLGRRGSKRDTTHTALQNIFYHLLMEIHSNFIKKQFLLTKLSALSL